jgi:hypothetical protein
MSSQMAAFLDQAGGLWARGALNGKVGGAFTSSATQHGGNETTLFSIITNLLHFGMTIVGLPYSHQGQMTLDEITGGAPYGATTIAGQRRLASAQRTGTGRRPSPGRTGRQDRGQAVRLNPRSGLRDDWLNSPNRKTGRPALWRRPAFFGLNLPCMVSGGFPVQA